MEIGGKFYKEKYFPESTKTTSMKMIKRLETPSHEERLRSAQEKRGLMGDLNTVFQYLKVGYKEDRGSLFTRSHM